MSSKKFSRRDVLRTAAASGAFIAGSRLPAFADDVALPQGVAGKLTVIHRTEYFPEAQTLFRDEVDGVRQGEQCPARHLDDQPGIVRRLSSAR